MRNRLLSGCGGGRGNPPDDAIGRHSGYAVHKETGSQRVSTQGELKRGIANLSGLKVAQAARITDGMAGFALGWDRRSVQPQIKQILPSGGAGLLASFARVGQDLFPDGAQDLQELLGWAQESPGNGQPPMLHQADELFEAHLALMTQPAFGAGMRMPQKEQDRADQTGPDFALDPVRVGGFGFIQAQD